MARTGRILHVLSQRPGRTGSGVTLEALVQQAASRGWEQRAVVGTSCDDIEPGVAGLCAEHIHPLVFGRPSDGLGFALPGMSDVMPYDSSRFADLDPEEIARYLEAWEQVLGRVLVEFEPDLIHAHHLWLVSSSIRDLAPHTPLVLHCHTTGFRQMALCPHLAGRVCAGCSRADRFLVLAAEHARQLASELGVDPGRVHVVGAGYCEEIFSAEGRKPVPGRMVYAGKLARAKGLDCLLDAFALLRDRVKGAELHAAGSGSGAESEALELRLQSMPGVVWHGPLSQPDLAALLRTAHSFVLPSFYEGLGLVLIEALACGCRLVATRSSGVEEQIAPFLGRELDLVELPPMSSIDEPLPGEVPGFVQRLAVGLERSLARHPLEAGELPDLSAFSWRAVFERIESVWRELLGG